MSELIIELFPWVVVAGVAVLIILWFWFPIGGRRNSSGDFEAASSLFDKLDLPPSSPPPSNQDGKKPETQTICGRPPHIIGEIPKSCHKVSYKSADICIAIIGTVVITIILLVFTGPFSRTPENFIFFFFAALLFPLVLFICCVLLEINHKKLFRCLFLLILLSLLLRTSAYDAANDLLSLMLLLVGFIYLIG
ncbi:MAG: hypothetical protein JW749_12040 [Sedimentisphaerales bacterium]|nr:hypothetical protein [Sedimentisphaerales bacterium]